MYNGFSSRNQWIVDQKEDACQSSRVGLGDACTAQGWKDRPLWRYKPRSRPVILGVCRMQAKRTGSIVSAPVLSLWLLEQARLHALAEHPGHLYFHCAS